MRQPHIDDHVRLIQDVPQFALSRGDVGIVRSTWFAPALAYEVEFHQIGSDYQMRCILNAEQVAVEDESVINAVENSTEATSEFIAQQ